MKIGACDINLNPKDVEGGLVELNGESFYRIENVDEMPAFFMSVVSDSNHWMFIGSNGGLSCGRTDRDRAIFPYYTDDKIIESTEISGPKTVLKINRGEDRFLWEPFSNRYQGLYEIKRSLFKNALGNKIIFQEINESLDLTFEYQWSNSKDYGFLRSGRLTNTSNEFRSIDVLDGVQNILPTFIPSEVQAAKSNLVDAYKRHEYLQDSGLGIYTLNAVIVDRAEPSESLKSTIAYHLCDEPVEVYIYPEAVDQFRRDIKIDQITESRGKKGAYFVHFDLGLEANSEHEWNLILDESQSAAKIIERINLLQNRPKHLENIKKDVEKGSQNLEKLVAQADGLQFGEDRLENNRHFANVMFNIMRGGIFLKDYQFEKKDFLDYIKKSNKSLWTWINSSGQELPASSSREAYMNWAHESGNKDLIRLTKEYLPLYFSRRHGDPSRPWNKFAINTYDEITGENLLDYQGNWRDIYQNWEALAYSYPVYIEAMISKFLNTSTFDGYNPYRISKYGFDWEVIEEHDPWAFIGYWGDHQIIYLLKFLEFSRDYFPGQLMSMMSKSEFVYAAVPYKIKGYQDILENPKDTIEFDYKWDVELRESRAEKGADGALLTYANGDLVRVGFMEKILATLLAKCSNYIPDGGIWLNTQRPEWNDANNALVGNGVSMVTLYYLRRFVKFWIDLIQSEDFAVQNLQVNSELALFFKRIKSVFQEFEGALENGFGLEDRKKMMDALGQSGADYRNKIYENGFEKIDESLSVKDVLDLLISVNKHLESSIKNNKKEDGLYHSYNLLSYTEDLASISHLPSMLEGQVAVLTSKYLDAKQSLELIGHMEKSDLYREDQNSYMLYPNAEVSDFLNKNKFSEERANQSKLFKSLLDRNDRSILRKDLNGHIRFNSNFHNHRDLNQAIEQLDEGLKAIADQDGGEAFLIFEEVFNHKAFTGRSSTFFGYEGLGSIYWHMVSKWVLAIEEVYIDAKKSHQDPVLVKQLAEAFQRAKNGIGVHKTPEVYGAIPTDPYSHTPAHKGAQQPGMTGQVKEDVISRFMELGVSVEKGCIHFDPSQVNEHEFLRETTKKVFYDVKGNQQEVVLRSNSLFFTYCQVPVIYKKAESSNLIIHLDDGGQELLDVNRLSTEFSESIINRAGRIKMIEVSFS